MGNLPWKNLRNLENSFAEFLQAQIASQSLTIIDGDGASQAVQMRVGSEVNSNWALPVIQIYVDSKLSPRLSIGSNKRQDSYLMVIDIRSLDKGSQIDLTEWVQETINDGFIFYEYTPVSGDPENPTKVQTGYVSIDFISNIPLRLGDGADIFEKYRQNITLSCTI